MVVSLKNLKDYQVLDSAGETLGTINDVILGPDLRRARYFVLSTRARPLGPGKARYVVPTASVNLDTENEAFVIDLDPERLANAPPYAELGKGHAQDAVYRLD